MTNEQLYLAIGVPIAFNTVLTVTVYVLLSARISDLDLRFERRFIALEASLETRFTALNQRFDDMRDLWRAELQRVEEVLDARLKHLEGR